MSPWHCARLTVRIYLHHKRDSPCSHLPYTRLPVTTLALLLGLLLTACADLANLVESRLDDHAVLVTGAVVNLREGPSLDHAVLDHGGQEGDLLPVIGISASRTWLQVQPDGLLRWIYADLTDIDPEIRAALPVVAAPPLPVAEVEAAPAVPVEPLVADYIYVAPGSYDRTRYPALNYEWELVFSDNSEQWNWIVADFAGCYDAMRVYLGELPRQYGLKRAEITLSDPPVARDLTTMPRQDFTHAGGVFMPGTATFDDERLRPLWPDWGDRVVSDFALARSTCTDWPYKLEDYDLGEYTCEVYPLWGHTETERGRHNLNAAGTQIMTRTLGSVLFADDGASAFAWLEDAWSKGTYLYPQDSDTGVPEGDGPCLRLIRK